MPLKGVKLLSKDNCRLYLVEDFDKQLKVEIQTQLAGIFHGFNQVENLPLLYDYKTTLKLFLEKFEGKTLNQRKGMIGELLAHIIINKYEPGLRCLSVLQNKEENNVKKGFDIIYFENAGKRIWYTEVKSGRGKKGAYSSKVYNNALIKRSFKGITAMFKKPRNVLWTSALIDVELMVKDFKGKQKIRELLSQDVPVQNNKGKKNAILVSILYHGLGDILDLDSICETAEKIAKHKKFSDLLVFSIQKATYEKVIKFLKEEAKK